MSLVLAHKTNSLENALVISGKLEAVGFTPFIKNYFHGGVALGYHLALDGFHIFLPEEELESATLYMNQDHEILEYDPMKSRKYGMWKRGTVFCALILSFGALPLPLYFLSPVIITLLLLFASVLLIVLGYLFPIFWFFIPLMLAHAKYIAVPRLRQQDDTSR